LGDNAVLQIDLDGGLVGPGRNGLQINAGGSTVRGLVINHFGGNPGTLTGGILLQNQGGNVIEGDFLGTDATGTSNASNLRGIMILGSSNNTIGGTTTAARNIISGA